MIHLALNLLFATGLIDERCKPEALSCRGSRRINISASEQLLSARNLKCGVGGI